MAVEIERPHAPVLNQRGLGQEPVTVVGSTTLLVAVNTGYLHNDRFKLYGSIFLEEMASNQP